MLMEVLAGELVRGLERLQRTWEELGLVLSAHITTHTCEILSVLHKESLPEDQREGLAVS